MTELIEVGGHRLGVAANAREDRWWVAPVSVLIGLTAFVIYVTWAALQGTHYFAAPYLSPLYSPVLVTLPTAAGSAPVGHAWFGLWPSWWPSFIPPSPAILILVFPGLFRFTCYYYRKAYYRAFTWTPPACAVAGIPRKNYKGETGLLVFQNLHRYALYPAVIYIIILYYDAFYAFVRDGQFGIGVGTVVLFINATLLAGYTFGCHAFRHLVGGGTDCFSCSKARHNAWQRASRLNRNHQFWAWASLFWVAFTDFYVRMVSMGVITDFNTWGG